jgi:hypothetical protein
LGITPNHRIVTNELFGLRHYKITDYGKPAFIVLFGDNCPLARDPVLPTLRHFAEFVTRTVDEIGAIFLAEGK